MLEEKRLENALKNAEVCEEEIQKEVELCKQYLDKSLDLLIRSDEFIHKEWRIIIYALNKKKEKGEKLTSEEEEIFNNVCTALDNEAMESH